MMRYSSSSRALFGVAAAALAVAGAGGIAVAAIPNSDNGHIVACYPTSGPDQGLLRVIDNQAGQTCAAGSKQVVWNDTGVHFKGAYSSTTQYRKNDLVTSSGQTYIALLDNKNVSVTSATWALFAAKGANGSVGPAGPPGPTFKGQFFPQSTWSASSQGSDWQVVSSQTFTTTGTSNILAEYTAESFCQNVSWCSARVVLDGTEMTGGSGTGYAFDDADPQSTWEGHAFNRYLASVPAGTHTVQVQAFLVGPSTTASPFFRLDDATLTLEQIG
jgi:hypothetical protein